MKRRFIKLTESDLHRVIENSVKKILEGYSKPKTVFICNEILEDYKAQEMAEEYGLSEEEAAIEWFNEITTEADFEEQNMPKYSKFISDMPDAECELYKDYGAGYYFLVRRAHEPLKISNGDKTLNTLTNPYTESRYRRTPSRLIETDCAGVMQTGAGNAPKGTNPEAGQYTVPLGGDSETSDRHPGFSVDGKAKWNKKGSNTSVMRRTMYNPKSGK